MSQNFWQGENRKTIILVQLLVVFSLQVYCSNVTAKQNQEGEKMFFVVASSSNMTYSRIFNKTLTNLTRSLFPKERYQIELDTLIIDLPVNGSFSAIFLEELCEKLERKRVIAMFVIGDSPAASTVSLAATHIGIPVLWARGQDKFLPGFRSLAASPLEIQLTPTGRELVSALRGLLLHAHWHTFTLLADPASATALRGPELWPILRAQPLHPTLIALPSPLRAQSLFRKLADISRSTRGVVVLLSDKTSAMRILEEAKRLNMMDGHFVWLWIDTSANISFREFTEEDRDKEVKNRRDADSDERTKRSLTKSDINELHINYLLQNDRFLLFNRDLGTRSSVSKKPNPEELKSIFHVKSDTHSELPAGLLYLRPLPVKVDRHLVKGAVRLLAVALKMVLNQSVYNNDALQRRFISTSCWRPTNDAEKNISLHFGRTLREACNDALAGKKFTQEIGVDKVDKSLVANFEILNLISEKTSRDTTNTSVNGKTETARNNTQQNRVRWKRVGLVSGRSVRLDTIVWPGGDLSVAAISSRARTAFRVVTALSPPFVMESELDEDGQCLRGLPCHRVLTSDKDNLTLVFNEMRRLEDEEEEKEEAMKEVKNSDYYNVEYEDEKEPFLPFQKFKYKTNCCYGLAMDLLENIAQELEFDFRLYIVADGLFGSQTLVKKKRRNDRDVGKKFLSYKFKDLERKSENSDGEEEEDVVEKKWNGIVGDIVSGAAHMSFAALSVSSARSEVMDFSVPYFFSGVSFLAAPQQKSDIPLLAFLLPFSPELWIAIFTSLNITAIAVAIYEWLSPFGLNPWGRQRSKNFSMSSALWVMWGLLCGHLVAFKAPKSWPNKFLINVWGGFSVIFVASYTANIAALIAGLFFHDTVSNYHDRSLLSQKVGAPKASAAEYYVQKANQHLWQHMHRYTLGNIEEGVERLRNGSLDILIADTPILDYYRATDHGCKLQKIGDTINEDTYAIGMTKGFPLKDSISAVIAKYSSNGYMDILQEKWYGGLPCFKLVQDIVQPRPLGVRAVTGVFILLGLGVILGLLILVVEHWFFRYTLPALREKPKGSVWRSRNIMFFSQKLYRFINCVELVSPHHAARELVHTIRQGQITSLFQKSIKREHEQRRRRKSKAQFFEMIQEIRSTLRRQQEESQLEAVTEVDSEGQSSPEERKSKISPSLIKRTFMRSSPKSDANKIRSPTSYFNRHPLFSPRSRNKTKSATNLNVRRFSTDSIFNSSSLLNERSNLVGRRLSRDASSFLTSSPPDINSRRSSYLDTLESANRLSAKSPVLSIENVSDCSAKSMEPIRKLSDSESIGRKLATLPKYKEAIEKQFLHPQHSLNLRKSEETLSSVEKRNVLTARSFTNISETEPTTEGNPIDDEIARRNKMNISELTKELSSRLETIKHQENNVFPKQMNPLIKIHVEDTTNDTEEDKPKLQKTRHQSLGEVVQNDEIPAKKKLQEASLSLDNTNPGNCPSPREIRPPKLKRRDECFPEVSKSLDSHPVAKKHRSTRNKKEESVDSKSAENDPSSKLARPNRLRKKEESSSLPPAPPPPNCSPRNSNGRSPLERLSKDELVHLWRSSESELRSHLLKAIRDKEESSQPP
ncbi:uncharacterized protein LOC123314202 isoform X2 [Coccinella septempunctata]|uniref:uncharacterized protein LOC123314202 isoform X2 n=1 Tax=Coccinella septempunctata TaxID=41139 RepID=UPI001D088B9B|nr:uncharacterized protein LOC123314202 isoform X2 [Coccinella septempunctata]